MHPIFISFASISIWDSLINAESIVFKCNFCNDRKFFKFTWFCFIDLNLVFARRVLDESKSANGCKTISTNLNPRSSRIIDSLIELCGSLQLARITLFLENLVINSFSCESAFFSSRISRLSSCTAQFFNSVPFQ